MLGEWTLNIAATATEARLEGVTDPQSQIIRICTDTRQIQPGDLFVCLKGERFDAP